MEKQTFEGEKRKDEKQGDTGEKEGQDVTRDKETGGMKER